MMKDHGSDPRTCPCPRCTAARMARSSSPRAVRLRKAADRARLREMRRDERKASRYEQD